MFVMFALSQTPDFNLSRSCIKMTADSQHLVEQIVVDCCRRNTKSDL